MWTNPQSLADLVTFTKEFLNGKLHFFVGTVSASLRLFCSRSDYWHWSSSKFLQSNFYHSLAIQVNANDEGGVVKGSWSGDYSDGIEPWAWTGSTAMLEEYMRTRRPVKYGQCWNFCGVLTTCKDLLGWSLFGVPVTQHCLKYARIRVFSDLYFPVFLFTILTW